MDKTTEEVKPLIVLNIKKKPIGRKKEKRVKFVILHTPVVLEFK